MANLINISNTTSCDQDSVTTGNHWDPGRWSGLAAALWMALQASMAFALALATSSMVLLGMALDSGVELVASSSVLWRLFAGQHHLAVKRIEQGERLILRITAVGLFVLASYLLQNSVLMLAMRIRPRLSWWSIALAAMAILIQPLLWQSKWPGAGGARERRASTLRISALFLPWIVLIGLLLHHLVGWWWADPLAAFAIGVFLILKGWQAMRLSLPCSTKGAFCTFKEVKQ